MSRCEFEGCDNAAGSAINGISVCERCRLDYGSAGCGVVYFGGKWHGVRGARYTDEQVLVFPGIERAVEVAS